MTYLEDLLSRMTSDQVKKQETLKPGTLGDTVTITVQRDRDVHIGIRTRMPQGDKYLVNLFDTNSNLKTGHNASPLRKVATKVAALDPKVFKDPALAKLVADLKAEAGQALLETRIASVKDWDRDDA